jgi:hypothetical protein
MDCKYVPVGFGECTYPELNCDPIIKKCLKNPDQPCLSDSECINGKKCVEYYNGKKCESLFMNALYVAGQVNTAVDDTFNQIILGKSKPKKFKRFYRK